MKFVNYAAAIVAMSLVGCAPAAAQSAKAINTGGQAGAYHSTFCPPIPAALANAYFQGYTCQQSGGTIDNIARVMKQPTNIGFAQLDVYARAATERPDDFKKLAIIRSDLACEGLWMITKNPDLDFGKVLWLSRRIKFVLPSKTSGSQASFDYLRKIDPEGLGHASDGNIVNVADATAVINFIANSTNGEVGFFVQFADPRNSNIKLMMEKNLRIIPVLSREILTSKVDGTDVYSAQTFDMTIGGIFTSAKQVTTACTPVAIFTGSPDAFSDRNGQDDAKDLIERVRAIPSEKLLPQDDTIAKILRGAKRLSNAALEQAIAATDAAREAASKALN